MSCPSCKKAMSVAKTVLLRSGRTIRVLECRACGHAHIETLVASA